MIEQEELPYTSSSSWESWPETSDWSSDLSDQIGGRYMGLAGLEPIQPNYRNNIDHINWQLGNMHGQAAEDYMGFRMRQRRIRRLRTQLRNLTNLDTFVATPNNVNRVNWLRNEIQTLNEQIVGYENFIESGGTYSDDDIIN